MRISCVVVAAGTLALTAKSVEAQEACTCGAVLSGEDRAVMLERQRRGVYSLPADDGGIAGQTQYVIPVSFHVVRRSNGTGGINEAQLTAGMTDLNQSFADAGMGFCKVGPTLYVDSDFYYYQANTTLDILELFLIGHVPATVNVYLLPFLTTEAGALCGLATYSTYGESGGVAMRYSCMGTSNDITFPHEVGHYFDLFHTHEGTQCTSGVGCENTGDLLCDTPPDPLLGIHNVAGSPQGCVYVGHEPDPCGTSVPYDPLTNNFMSYVPLGCGPYIFTPGQLNRARATLLKERPELALPECPSGTGQSADLSRVSINSQAQQSNGHSSRVAVSADGRYVVFASEATNLDPRDTSPIADIYLHDRFTATTELVSVSMTDTGGNGASGWPCVSVDGRFVVFESTATNLVPNVTIPFKQVYLRDRQTQSTTLITTAIDGPFANSDSGRPAMTPDGLHIAFASYANDLVANDSNSAVDVFVHDVKSRQTTRVSVGSNGEQGNGSSPGLFEDRVGISDDGRFVVFGSAATNFLMPDINDSSQDIFVHDRQTGATALASRSSSGAQGDFGGDNPAISGDGRYVVFQSASSNFAPDPNGLFADAFLHDRVSGQTTLIGVDSEGQQYPLGTGHATISHDGRRVVFQQAIAFQFPTTNNVFMRDLVSGEHVRLNPPMDGIGGGIGTKYAAISANGNLAVYQSDAANLVQDDSNQRTDTFAFALPGQSALPGDTNGDGQVNVDDLVAVILAWGPCPTSGACDADVNGSGAVDVDDLVMIILNWQA